MVTCSINVDKYFKKYLRPITRLYGLKLIRKNESSIIKILLDCPTRQVGVLRQNLLKRTRSVCSKIMYVIKANVTVAFFENYPAGL